MSPAPGTPALPTGIGEALVHAIAGACGEIRGARVVLAGVGGGDDARDTLRRVLVDAGASVTVPIADAPLTGRVDADVVVVTVPAYEHTAPALTWLCGQPVRAAILVATAAYLRTAAATAGTPWYSALSLYTQACFEVDVTPLPLSSHGFAGIAVLRPRAEPDPLLSLIADAMAEKASRRVKDLIWYLRSRSPSTRGLPPPQVLRTRLADERLRAQHSVRLGQLSSAQLSTLVSILTGAQLSPPQSDPAGAQESHQYWTGQPTRPSEMSEVHLDVDGRDVVLRTDRNVFSRTRIDRGTEILLRAAPRPPPAGELLDLGCGYGPIAITLALRAPGAHVWAVDVNRRALWLTAFNAERCAAGNVTAVPVDDVPADVRFDAIYSNPPIRIGKRSLYGLLQWWLTRLKPGGRAYLVINRKLGAESLMGWLRDTGHEAEVVASEEGYRVLAVRSISHGAEQTAQE